MIEPGMYHRGYAVITKFPPRMPSRWKPALNVLVNGSSSGTIFSQALVMHVIDPLQIVVPGYSEPLAVNKNIPWRKIQLEIDVIAVDVRFTNVLRVTKYKNVVLDYHTGHLHLARSLGYAVEDVPVDGYQAKLTETLAEHNAKMHEANPELFKKEGGVDLFALAAKAKPLLTKTRRRLKLVKSTPEV
jgi:hypothetical protein